ncbi:TolC family protein [Pseudomonas bohemica]|uniref:TolC family protein n=1 Tax=Pseudomonas bohemica TaxID=2044872 RepID=UPI000DA6332D
MTLYKESRLEDPRILSAYAHARSAKQQEREAFGGLLPQVTASSNINRILRKDDLSRDIYDNKSYSLNLSQFVYNKEAWERYQKAKRVTLQKSLQSEDSQAEATVDLAKRYFAALAADDALALVSAERRATQGSLDRVNALYARQMAKNSDLLKSQYDFITNLFILNRWAGKLSQESVASVNVWLGGDDSEALKDLNNSGPQVAPK